MIHILPKRDNNLTKIHIPKNSIDNQTSFFLWSRLTNKVYSFEGLEDLLEYRDYFTFEVDFSKIPDGEYEMTIGEHHYMAEICREEHKVEKPKTAQEKLTEPKSTIEFKIYDPLK